MFSTSRYRSNKRQTQLLRRPQWDIPSGLPAELEAELASYSYDKRIELKQAPKGRRNRFA